MIVHLIINLIVSSWYYNHKKIVGKLSVKDCKVWSSYTCAPYKQTRESIYFIFHCKLTTGIYIIISTLNINYLWEILPFIFEWKIPYSSISVRQIRIPYILVHPPPLVQGNKMGRKVRNWIIVQPPLSKNTCIFRYQMRLTFAGTIVYRKHCPTSICIHFV